MKSILVAMIKKVQGKRKEEITNHNKNDEKHTPMSTYLDKVVDDYERHDHCNDDGSGRADHDDGGEA